MKAKLILRPGRPSDAPRMLALIKELAVYEKAPNEVTLTAKMLRADGFGKKPLFKTIVAQLNGKVVGLALYFFSYSTWKGKCVYLEDIIVTQACRGQGIGKALFEEMMRISHQYGAMRLQFQALKWNKPALAFYKKHGAVVNGEWFNIKLTAAQLKKWASGQKR